MSSKVNVSTASPGKRLRAMASVCVLVAVALSMILNGCGGSSPSSATAPSQPTQPSGPSVSSGSVINCSGDFYSNVSTPAVCQTATVMGCPNAANLNVTYSYDAPASPKGTIVFFAGGKGTVDQGDVNAATYYFSQGYEVIQVEWADDWELTTIPAANGGSDTTTYTANIQLAACRNAALLNYIFTGGNTKLYSSGGRCAQGSSAGSAAIAYALTFYGAGNYLDAVELISGPPLADLEQGCEEPPPPSFQVCPAGQFGCQLGNSSPWTLSPQYQLTQQDPGAAPGVRTWTNDNSCNQLGTTTSSTSNQAWLKQSIVNDGTNNPVYSYPNTSMSAWLCASVYQPAGAPCTQGISSDGGQGGVPQTSCPNNSSSQAQIYYAKLASNPNNLKALNVYAVQNCAEPEGVDGPNTTVPALNNLDGTDAVQQDMVQRCVRP